MKKRLIELKWGTIFVLALLLWTVFERLMGWHGERIDQHESMTLLFSIIAITIYVFALLDKRNTDFKGFMSWKQGFVSGFFISLVVAILSPLSQVIIHYVITPDFFNTITEHTVETGQMTREDAEAYFSLSGYIVQSMVGALGMGIVTSAIVAVFTKRLPNPKESAED